MSNENSEKENDTQAKPTITIAEKQSGEKESKPTITIAEREQQDQESSH